MDFISSTFPYIGTPYENYRSDISQMLDEIVAIEHNIKKNQISPPFYESMMSIIFRKL